MFLAVHEGAQRHAGAKRCLPSEARRLCAFAGTRPVSSARRIGGRRPTFCKGALLKVVPEQEGPHENRTRSLEKG